MIITFENMKSLLKRSGIQYFTVFILVIVCSFSFAHNGVYTLTAIFLVYLVIPILEWLIPVYARKISDREKILLLKNKFFDLALYLIVPAQYFLLFQFLNRVSNSTTTLFEAISLTITMGIACGVLDINVAHELGHRTKPLPQFLANALLLTSLYMHFYIEHNKGHHKHVATFEDPSTARYGESVYSFWLRCIPSSLISAWNIECKRLSRNQTSKWSIENQMLQYAFIQFGFIILIYLLFGFAGILFFVASALIGILHLETVNYIEHYGLMRKRANEFRYENVQVWHSWNNNRILGRLFLFNLTLHSDHHYNVHKPYQILETTSKSPQLPVGYPTAMLMSLLPMLWFSTMHPIIKELNCD